MEENRTPRRPDRTGRDTAASLERPQTPAGRPSPARPRSGTASQQAQARKERLQAAARDREEPARPIRRVEPGELPDQSAEAPAKKKKKKKKVHRVYNTNFSFKFLTMLAVVAVLTLAIVIFFKVKHIQVVFLGTTGYNLTSTQTTEAGDPAEQAASEQSYYTAEEVIAAAGISIDDNLISISKAAIASRIHAALPYINQIQIKRVLPGTVVISVSEFKVTYGIQDEAGGWWLLSREGRVLESTDEQGVKGHLILTGMPIRVPKAGDSIKPAAADGADMSEIAAKRNAAVLILPELEKTAFAKKIVSVDLSSSYNIILWYGTQYEIRIGNTENLTYKLQCLQGVLEELGKDKSGTIDVTFTEDNAAHFLPFG